MRHGTGHLSDTKIAMVSVDTCELYTLLINRYLKAMEKATGIRELPLPIPVSCYSSPQRICLHSLHGFGVRFCYNYTINMGKDVDKCGTFCMAVWV